MLTRLASSDRQRRLEALEQLAALARRPGRPYVEESGHGVVVGCSSLVTVAKCAAHAWIAAALAVCESSTGWDWSIRAVMELRFLRASMRQLRRTGYQSGQLGAESAYGGVALVDSRS